MRAHEGDYARVNGLEMYYEVHGTGEPLILLHGGVGAIEMFGEVLPLLAQDLQVIAVELQGHGRTADIDRPLSFESMADDIRALIEHLGLEEAVHEGSPFTFVTNGVESAVEQAKQAAGAKDIGAGAASIAQQCIEAGLLDEIQIHLAPVLLNDGVRLFDHPGAEPIDLESMRVVETPGVTHLRFRVVKDG